MVNLCNTVATYCAKKESAISTCLASHFFVLLPPCFCSIPTFDETRTIFSYLMTSQIANCRAHISTNRVQWEDACAGRLRACTLRTGCSTLARPHTAETPPSVHTAKEEDRPITKRGDERGGMGGVKRVVSWMRCGNVRDVRINQRQQFGILLELAVDGPKLEL